MNLKMALLEEHSKKQCNLIVQWIGDHKGRFDELMDLFFTSEYRITQRAAWPMSYCVKNHPKWVQDYFKRLLDLLERKEPHDAVKRNIVRLLQEVKIPKRYQGRLMSICFGFIQSSETAVAIKAFSLTILGNLAAQFPEIIPEIKLIIEERWEIETAAFRSRAKKLINMKVKAAR
jgi:hypothetical protein